MTFKALTKVLFIERQPARMDAVVSSGNVQDNVFVNAGVYVGVSLHGSVCPPYDINE